MLALRDSSFIINTLLLLILEPFSPLHHSLSSCLLVQLGLSVCLLEPLAIFWPKLQLSEIPVSAIHFCQNSQQSNCSIVEMRCCQMSPQLYHLSTSKSFFRAVGPNNPIEGFILVPCCSLKATLQHCLVSQADIYMGLISWKRAMIMVDRLSLSASLLVLPATPGVSNRGAVLVRRWR